MVYKTRLQLLQNSFRAASGSLCNFSIIHTTEREKERKTVGKREGVSQISKSIQTAIIIWYTFYSSKIQNITNSKF